MNYKIKALLFDLDKTLLNINETKFASKFMQLAIKKLKGQVTPKFFVKKFANTINALNNNAGEKLNIQVYNESIFPLKELLDDIYEEIIPKLKIYTQSIPIARKVIQEAFSKGFKVIIASNPIFPTLWLNKRLEWAKISDFSYNYISTMENSRACKSMMHSFYYSELREKINLPAELCLMIGDQAIDMVSSKIGMKTFLIKTKNTLLKNINPTPTYKGSLLDLISLIRQKGKGR